MKIYGKITTNQNGIEFLEVNLSRGVPRERMKRIHEAITASCTDDEVNSLPRVFTSEKISPAEWAFSPIQLDLGGLPAQVKWTKTKK
jgi:hypothetical protein